MNILHIIPDATVSFGGPVTSMNNIIGLWLADGHKVQVLTVDRGGQPAQLNAPVEAAPPSFPRRLANSNEAAAWLAKSFARFNLVFVHCVWTAINIRSALLLGRRRHPYVLVPHGSMDAFDLRKKSLAKRILGPLIIRRCLQGSATVLCSSQREADCLVKYGATPKVAVLPWPVPPVPSKIERRDARQALGIGDGEFMVLSLGRVDYKKGFPVLLPAVRQLRTFNPGARLFIVGPDSNGYMATVRQLVSQLGLESAVTFVPQVTGVDKARLQCAADCFALPSLNENFGNTVVEAMQQGLPCVISDNVYICDSVERGGAGLVCRYDADEVSAALRRISEDQSLRAGMSANALRVAREFEPARLKERYLALLRELALPEHVPV